MSILPYTKNQINRAEIFRNRINEMGMDDLIDYLDNIDTLKETLIELRKDKTRLEKINKKLKEHANKI